MSLNTRQTVLDNNTSVYKNVARKEYDISDEKREEYRKISQESRISKLGKGVAINSVFSNKNVTLN